MWFPTKILHLGPNQMVKRAIGDLYFFGSGQSVCMTYGTITESAKGSTEKSSLSLIIRKGYSSLCPSISV